MYIYYKALGSLSYLKNTVSRLAGRMWGHTKLPPEVRALGPQLVLCSQVGKLWPREPRVMSLQENAKATGPRAVLKMGLPLPEAPARNGRPSCPVSGTPAFLAHGCEARALPVSPSFPGPGPLFGDDAGPRLPSALVLSAPRSLTPSACRVPNMWQLMQSQAPG